MHRTALWLPAIAVVFAALAARAQVTPMQIDHDVTVDSMVSDRFTWYDTANHPRVAVLAHNDNGAGPGGAAGGALRELRYQLPNGDTRVVTVTTYGNAGYAGFGYVVSHSSRYAGCVGDDSPLGGFIAGQWSRVFEGRHHAIFRFTQNYPRNCPTTAPVQGYTMPVTIDWIFSTGRDNPVWAITYDVDLATPAGGGAAAPANTFYDDSRAPYGELNIDGDGTTDIDGTAWGDRYRFTSTSSPIDLNSSWTWNVANTVPYVKEWLNGPLAFGDVKDATMGLVQTQTMTQQDAGGARDPGVGSDITPLWKTTSATCPGCPNVCAAGEDMPCPDNWPYQANGDSLFGGSNNNARLTWKTQYGFLGQTSYDVNDGVIATAPGWPKKSYSVYVILGTHSSGPVEAQRTQVETMQSVTLSASTGSVVTSGPAGITRADDVTYAPAGYNHVYGALAFNASGNALDANIAVGSGTLTRPLIIVGNYSGGTPQVKLGGAALTADVDYFASLRTAPNELWITLNANLSGTANHLQIGGAAAHGFYVLTPCRLFDSRNPDGPYGGPALAAASVRNIAVAGQCGVPAGAASVTINVTVPNSSSTGWLTLFPGPPGTVVPFVSTINYNTVRVTANNAVVPLGPDGTMNVYNSGPYAAHGIIDVSGYFQ